jgi:hypothetical protein
VPHRKTRTGEQYHRARITDVQVQARGPGRPEPTRASYAGRGWTTVRHGS